MQHIMMFSINNKEDIAFQLQYMNTKFVVLCCIFQICSLIEKYFGSQVQKVTAIGCSCPLEKQTFALGEAGGCCVCACMFSLFRQISDVCNPTEINRLVCV